MRHTLTLFAALFFCAAPGSVLGQTQYELTPQWDNTLPSPHQQVLHDFILLDDGRVAMVGEINARGQKKDGFFALLEANTFRAIKNIPLGQFRDDVFTGVAYAGDETFYLVGYTDTDDKGRQGRVVRIDAETGEILFDKQFGDKGDDQFDKIIWLPESGHGLLAGRSQSLPEGRVWMAKADGNEVTVLQNDIGGGIVGELIGMEKGPDCVWLSGYTQKVKNYSKGGDVFVLRVNSEGISAEQQRTIKAGSGQALLGMTGTVDGELYLAGKVGNVNGDSDVWFAEVKPGQTEARTFTFGSDIQDRATSLFRTPGRSKWLVVNRTESRELIVQVYRDTIDQQSSIFRLTQNQDFHVNRICSIGNNRYLLAGTSYAGGSRSDGRVRLLCLQANENLRSKGIPEVKEGNIRFDDDGHDNKLAPGERGTLRFSLKNTSKDTPILNGEVQVKLVAGLPGATVNLSNLNLGELPIGFEKNTFGVSVRADKTLQSGEITLEFTVKANERVVRTFQATIVAEREAPRQPSPSQTDLTVTEPNMAGRDSRVVIVNEPTVKTSARAFSGNAHAKAADLKTNLNGRILPDDKSPARMKRLETPRPNRFEYIFEQTLQLQKGRNVVYFELEDARTDSIVFIFDPKKPNLHLLVIGVPQEDLKYTVKDARDFAQAMISQRGIGFFNEVFVDTLTTGTKTTVREIKKAFVNLENRSDNIKPEDYIVIFMSSHGVERQSDKSFGFVASDYEAEYKDISTVNYKEDIAKVLNRIECKKIVFIDACHSGSGKVSDGAKADPGEYERLQKRIDEANNITTGAATFFSCRASEKSWEDKSWQNGAFTEAILEALLGAMADTGEGLPAPSSPDESYAGDRFIAVAELEVFLKKRVPELVKTKDPGLTQNPQCEIKSPMKSDITLFQILKQ